MARALCGFAMAYLRLKRFDRAEAIYVDVLKRFSTTYAAPEAQYYLGVTRYRRDPDSDQLLAQWANLRSRYPSSEYRVKQSFKDFPNIPTIPAGASLGADIPEFVRPDILTGKYPEIPDAVKNMKLHPPKG